MHVWALHYVLQLCVMADHLLAWCYVAPRPENMDGAQMKVGRFCVLSQNNARILNVPRCRENEQNADYSKTDRMRSCCTSTRGRWPTRDWVHSCEQWSCRCTELLSTCSACLVCVWLESSCNCGLSRRWEWWSGRLLARRFEKSNNIEIVQCYVGVRQAKKPRSEQDMDVPATSSINQKYHPPTRTHRITGSMPRTQSDKNGSTSTRLSSMTMPNVNNLRFIGWRHESTITHRTPYAVGCARAHTCRVFAATAALLLMAKTWLCQFSSSKACHGKCYSHKLATWTHIIVCKINNQFQYNGCPITPVFMHAEFFFPNGLIFENRASGKHTHASSDAAQAAFCQCFGHPLH